MLHIKIFGIFLIAFSGAAYGFLAAEAFQKRCRILRDIYSKTDTLKEHIRSGAGELSHLLKICYGDCKFLEVSHSKVKVLNDGLKKDDILLIEEFFEGLGFMDAEGEYSRICLFENLLQTKYEEALKEAAGKSRLIKTAGISIGLALGILLI
ncbi:MAG: stage III sporulation protein AB [Clostridia bacterium]|nr:stage III sporulation protein AB [Clostridia bacterium]